MTQKQAKVNQLLSGLAQKDLENLRYRTLDDFVNYEIADRIRTDDEVSIFTGYAHYHRSFVEGLEDKSGAFKKVRIGDERYPDFLKGVIGIDQDSDKFLKNEIKEKAEKPVDIESINLQKFYNTMMMKFGAVHAEKYSKPYDKKDNVCFQLYAKGINSGLDSVRAHDFYHCEFTKDKIWSDEHLESDISPLQTYFMTELVEMGREHGEDDFQDSPYREKEQLLEKASEVGLDLDLGLAIYYRSSIAANTDFPQERQNMTKRAYRSYFRSSKRKFG